MSMAVPYTGHERIDRRSIALHAAIAAKLRARPELLQIAFDNLDRWAPNASHAKPYFDKWRELLARPLDELLPLLTEDTERMRALRQANPFAGILTPAERWSIYAEFAT